MAISWSELKEILRGEFNDRASEGQATGEFRVWLTHAHTECDSPDDLGVFGCAAKMAVGIARGLVSDEMPVLLFAVCRRILAVDGFNLGSGLNLKQGKEAEVISHALAARVQKVRDLLMDLSSRQ